MLSKFSVNRPYTIVVAVVLVLILGVISYMGMTTDLLPNIDFPYAMVMISYVGATPEEVELIVTKPVEQAMATVSNIKNVSSQSAANYSLVMLEFYQETNMDSVTQEMRENLDLIESAWTDENIGSPMIMKMNPDMMPVMISSVDMKGMEINDLSTFVDDTILPSFERLEGVASVSAMGLASEELKVTIDEDRIDLVNDAIAASIDGDIGKARSALGQARSQLNSASAQLEAELNKGAAEIAAGESQLNEGKKQLDSAEKELDTTIAGLNAQKQELTSQKSALSSQKSAIDSQIQELKDAGETVPQSLLDQQSTLSASIGKIDSGIAELNAGLSQAQGGKSELGAQRDALTAQEEQLQAGKDALASQGSEARAQIAQGKSQIESQSKKLETTAKDAKEDAKINDVITVEMITGILAAQNFSMPAGSLGENSNGYTVKVGDTIATVEEVENILLFELDMDGVDDVRLQDVADVSMSNSTDDSYTKVNGNDGILLMFQKQSNYSTSEVSQRINDEMAALEKEHEGLSLISFMDQGIYINMVTSSVMDNLILGGILAIFILLLFLKDLRPTLIVAVSIPASVLFAIVMMYFSGVTLNIISLSGLALGVGMLVDNSIVVIENIYRLRREGVPPKEAAAAGAKQVSGAITASTLTTICVFFPIVFTDGLSKQIFMDMGLTIAFSLIASLLVALSLVPSMASRTLKKEYKGEGRFFLKFKNTYGKVLGWTLRHKFIVLFLVIGLLFGSAYAAVARGYSFMPESDSFEMSATMSVEKDVSEEELFAMAETFMNKTLEIPEVTNVGAMDDNSMNSSSMGMGAGMGGSSVSSISFYFLLDENKDRKNDAIVKDMEAIAKDMNCEVAVTASNMDMSMLGGSGVQLIVKGEDLDKLADITEDLTVMLKDVKGVNEITTTMEEANPELVITVDKDSAMKEGFTVAQVYAAVSAAIDQGKTATTLTMEGKDYPIIVVDGAAETMTEDDIANIPLVAETPQGSMDGAANKETDEDEDEELTVGDVAVISEKQSPATISRANQERYMTVTALLDTDSNIGIVGQEVKAALEKYDIPNGYDVEIAGESVTIEDSISDLIQAILLAFVLTYLIMVAQFQSLKSPFIVMFTIPLAFTGGFLALIITGMDVSVIALLGFLVLTGVIVNNGIVLVDYINQLREKEPDLRTAVVEGAKTRIRPVLMTALTTALALVTMAMGLGMGAEMVQPMAIVCIGGLLYATVLTLFVVPIVYEILHKKRRKGKKKEEAFEVMEEETLDQ